ncbi:hypothetical protein VNO77_23440 [Canavalia gladiata]|uniref:Uncharacterized protein n=1 Tax=Canavalia gladiata TaxID=3824 RepID=A0AAN9Q8X7_CANGL
MGGIGQIMATNQMLSESMEIVYKIIIEFNQHIRACKGKRPNLIMRFASTLSFYVKPEIRMHALQIKLIRPSHDENRLRTGFSLGDLDMYSHMGIGHYVLCDYGKPIEGLAQWTGAPSFPHLLAKDQLVGSTSNLDAFCFFAWSGSHVATPGSHGHSYCIFHNPILLKHMHLAIPRHKLRALHRKIHSFPHHSFLFLAKCEEAACSSWSKALANLMFSPSSNPSHVAALIFATRHAMNVIQDWESRANDIQIANQSFSGYGALQRLEGFDLQRRGLGAPSSTSFSYRGLPKPGYLLVEYPCRRDPSDAPLLCCTRMVSNWRIMHAWAATCYEFFSPFWFNAWFTDRCRELLCTRELLHGLIIRILNHHGLGRCSGVQSEEDQHCHDLGSIHTIAPAWDGALSSSLKCSTLLGGIELGITQTQASPVSTSTNDHFRFQHTQAERALPQPLCVETKLPESIWLKFQYDSRGESRSGDLGQSSAEDRARPYFQGCLPRRLHDQYWLEREIQLTCLGVDGTHAPVSYAQTGTILCRPSVNLQSTSLQRLPCDQDCVSPERPDFPTPPFFFAFPLFREESPLIPQSKVKEKDQSTKEIESRPHPIREVLLSLWLCKYGVILSYGRHENSEQGRATSRPIKEHVKMNDPIIKIQFKSSVISSASVGYGPGSEAKHLNSAKWSRRQSTSPKTQAAYSEVDLGHLSSINMPNSNLGPSIQKPTIWAACLQLTCPIQMYEIKPADLQCSNTVPSMEKRLRAACNASNAKIDNVVKVLDALLCEYENSIQGSGKWQKLAVFLQQSFEGPVIDLTKRLIDKVESDKNSLNLKYRLIEDKMALLNKRLEASESEKFEYVKRYEDAINDKQKLTDEYMNRITDLQANRRSLDERQKCEEDQTSSEIASLKSRSSGADARLAAAREQSQSAKEEAEEWKRKYNISVREAKAALEKAAIVQERTNKQTQFREDALREEFFGTLSKKEDEIKEKTAKIEHAEQCLTTLKFELKAAESKIRNYESQISSMRLEIKELSKSLKTENAKAQSHEKDVMVIRQEINHLEEKYKSEFERFEEVKGRCQNAEKEAVKATEVADKARAEADMAPCNGETGTY